MIKIMSLLVDRSQEKLSEEGLVDSGVDSDTELAHSPDIVPDMDFGKNNNHCMI